MILGAQQYAIVALFEIGGGGVGELKWESGGIGEQQQLPAGGKICGGVHGIIGAYAAVDGSLEFSSDYGWDGKHRDSCQLNDYGKILRGTH